MRVLWPAGLTLALAITALLLVPSPPEHRLFNPELADNQLRDTLLFFSRSRADRCRVANRRDATMRRVDPWHYAAGAGSWHLEDPALESAFLGLLERYLLPPSAQVYYQREPCQGAVEVLGLDEFSAAGVYA